MYLRNVIFVGVRVTWDSQVHAGPCVALPILASFPGKVVQRAR